MDMWDMLDTEGVGPAVPASRHWVSPNRRFRRKHRKSCFTGRNNTARATTVLLTCVPVCPGVSNAPVIRPTARTDRTGEEFWDTILSTSFQLHKHPNSPEKLGFIPLLRLLRPSFFFRTLLITKEIPAAAFRVGLFWARPAFVSDRSLLLFTFRNFTSRRH